MNVYLNLSKLKAELGVTDTAQDPQLLRLLNRASRFIDKYCDRHFYMATATKRWRTEPGYWLSIPDLYSVTSVKLNDVALTAGSDYEFEPLYGYPKIAIRMLVSPFSARQELEIAGIWGYEETKDDSGDTVRDNPLSSTATVVNVTSGGNFAVGQALKVEDEQLYIVGISANALTVKRGINGTTAAEHAQGTKIFIYTYPDPIEQACFIQTIRWYRGRDAAWGDEVGIEGKLKYGLEPHPSFRVLLNPFRRIGGGF